MRKKHGKRDVIPDHPATLAMHAAYKAARAAGKSHDEAGPFSVDAFHRELDIETLDREIDATLLKQDGVAPSSTAAIKQLVALAIVRRHVETTRPEAAAFFEGPRLRRGAAVDIEAVAMKVQTDAATLISWAKAEIRKPASEAAPSHSTREKMQ